MIWLLIDAVYLFLWGLLSSDARIKHDVRQLER